MKKILISFFFSLFIMISFSITASADLWGEGEDDIDFGFNREGEFTYEVITGQHQGGYRYRTEGLVFRKDIRPNGDPISGTAGKDYIVVPVFQTGNPAPYNQNDYELLLNMSNLDDSNSSYISSVGTICEDITLSGNRIQTTCYIPEAIMEPILERLHDGNLKKTNNIYVSHLFQVSTSSGYLDSVPITNTDKYGRLVKTRTAMYNAAGWGPNTVAAIPDYYNRHTTYTPTRFMIKVYVDKTKDFTPPIVSRTWDSDDQLSNILLLLRADPAVLRAEAIKPDPQIHRDNEFRITLFTPIKIDLDATYYSLWDLKGSYVFDMKKREKVHRYGGTVLERTEQIQWGHTLVVAEYEQPEPTGCPDNCEPEGTPPACSVKVIETVTNPASTMVSGVTGSLLADAKGNHKFSVANSIPVTETLYTDNLAKPYLYSYTLDRYEGECEYNVSVSKDYKLTWTVDGSVCQHDITPETPNCTSWNSVNKSDDVTAYTTSTNTVKFTFWKVRDHALYRANSIKVMSNALPGGSVTISASGNPGSLTHNFETNLMNYFQYVDIDSIKLPAGTKSGSHNNRPSDPKASDIQSSADKALKDATDIIKVKNDNFSILGSSFMNNSWVNNNTSRPVIPTAPTANLAFYKDKNVIPSSVADGTYKTNGSISYSRIYSGGKTFNTTEVQNYTINDVVVRTPIYNSSSIDNGNSAFDQYWGARNRPTVVLGRDLTVNIGNSGQHLNILGFGNKDYSKYVKENEIRFSFPVISGGRYIAPNTYINIVGDSITVKVADFATEGTGTITTRTSALNVDGSYSCGSNANLNLGQNCGEISQTVNIVGRVYGFTIYDIGDLRYEKVFRTTAGKSNGTGYLYYSGTHNQNGSMKVDNAQKVLPIRAGSHPSEIATVPHNGYPFKFSFETLGQYATSNARVEVIPTFYFIPKSGGSGQEVDLYYNSTKAKFIKVGGSTDTGFSRKIQLSDPYRLVNQTSLQRTVEYEYDVLGLRGNASSRAAYINSAMKRSTTIATGYKNLTLPYSSKVLSGTYNSSYSGVSETTQRASKQTWFGEFSLPIDPYILPAGTNIEELARTKYKGSITGRESEFLKNGYIVVNFQIYVYKSGNTPYLAYDASPQGNANMWSIEKQLKSSTSYLGKSYNFNYGDVILFESDFSVKDDYK